MIDNQEDWGWYIGRYEEVYTSGPETHEDALRIARDEYNGAYICEARKEPVPLSSMFDAHDWIERCEERVYDEYVGEFGDCLFDLTPDQLESLQNTVRASIEKWQAENKLTFMPFMFTDVRNCQYIPGEEND